MGWCSSNLSPQNRAIRLIDNNYLTCHLDSLEHRRTICSLVVYYKYFNGICSIENASLIPRRATVTANTRRQLSFNRFSVVVDHARTDRYRNCFILRTTRLWNALPDYVFPTATNVNRFKLNANNYLRQFPLLILIGNIYPIF